MAKQNVSISKTENVYPKFLHPPKILNLSNLDRQCPTLMYVVFFYQPFHGDIELSLSLDSVFSSLKSGLEETLSVWFPAAGRLCLNHDDGKLNLWCNNHGAILVEAVTDVKISELGDLSLYNEFYENLVYKHEYDGTFSEMPLVVAQVTKFGCGGFSVGIGISHSLFDGPATYEFLRTWAASCAPKMREKRGCELHKPVHDRGMLVSATSQSCISSNQVRRVSAIDHLYQLIANAIGSEHGRDGKEKELGASNYVLKTFHLSGAMIESLKKKLFGEMIDSFSCSSFELIASHLWKARTKALGLKKEEFVCLQFAVDTRSKMVPPLPKCFSGNAYVLASIALSAGELEEESYESIIEKIREAKKSVNNEYVNAYMEGLNGPQQSLPPLKELTLVSDWTRMPFHKVDFMQYGQPAYAVPLVPPIPEVAYFMQNPFDNKGIHVRIGLHPQVIDVFSTLFFTHMQ